MIPALLALGASLAFWLGYWRRRTETTRVVEEEITVIRDGASITIVIPTQTCCHVCHQGVIHSRTTLAIKGELLEQFGRMVERAKAEKP